MKYIPEGHQDIEVFSIGYILFSENVIKEAEVTRKEGRYVDDKFGECKIEVYANEGQIPHFHLFNLDKSFETCICIYSNNYFAHGGKYTNKLNKRQCKELNDWLKQPNIKAPLSNWEMIYAMWEAGNSEKCKFPEKRKVTIQPDYSELLNYKNN